MTERNPEERDSEESNSEQIPLDIAGHEDREPPGSDAPFRGTDGDGASEGALEDEHDGVADGEDASDDAACDGDVEDAADAGDVGDEDAACDGDVEDAADAGDVGDEDAACDGDVEDAADGDDAGDADPYPDAVDDVEQADADGGDDEVEPIELLVQLAKDGEIDPWDVDVVAVTEEFLAALEDGDLRESARALFYASVLVRMKSDVLLEDPEAEAEDGEDPWDAPMQAPEDAPPAFDPVESLEDEMERRLQRKHVRGTPETLDELVRELREAERGSWWKESREYDTSASPSGFQRGTQTVDYHDGDARRRDGEPTAGEVTERTHGADIEDVIETVRAALAEHYDAGRPEVLFREVEDAGGSRVQTYLAALFLANRGELRLQQDELFGDLWLQDPTAELGTESAVAD